MAVNNKLFSERTGQVKILSIILGVVAVILTADHYAENYTEEKAFWWSLVVCLIISVVLAVLSLIGLLEHNNASQIDRTFHTLAAILLVIVSCFFIYRVDQTKNWYYERRAAAGACGLIWGVVCAYISGTWCF